MTEITTIFTCLHPLLHAATYRQLVIISQALLSMTGRVTMLGISRWAGKGESYRTIQRFFASCIKWETLNWAIINASLSKQNGVILVAGDATTVTKAGKETFGLGRFFSSICNGQVFLEGF